MWNPPQPYFRLLRRENMFQVNNKDTRTSSDVFIVNFERHPLNIFHTFFWWFHCWLWTGKCLPICWKNLALNLFYAASSHRTPLRRVLLVVILTDIVRVLTFICDFDKVLSGITLTSKSVIITRMWQTIPDFF